MSIKKQYGNTYMCEFILLQAHSLQREFVAIADKAESAKVNLKKSIASLDQVMKGLING